MILFESSDFGLILRLKEVQRTLQHELIWNKLPQITALITRCVTQDGNNRELPNSQKEHVQVLWYLWVSHLLN